MSAGLGQSRAGDGNAIYSTCVHRKEKRPTVLGGGVAGGVARARRGWSPECTGAAPEAGVGGGGCVCVSVCVCVCVCVRAWFSWLLESSLKRLRHCKQGVQTGLADRALASGQQLIFPPS